MEQELKDGTGQWYPYMEGAGKDGERQLQWLH